MIVLPVVVVSVEALAVVVAVVKSERLLVVNGLRETRVMRCSSFHQRLDWLVVQW